MQVSLIPWELIWLLCLLIFIISLFAYLFQLIKQRKIHLPQISWLYISLILLILIPVGLQVANYQFNLGQTHAVGTDPDYPVSDLQPRQYFDYNASELYEASIAALQSLSTYGQPWTISTIVFDEEADRGYITAKVPVFVFEDTIAISIAPVSRVPGEYTPSWRVDIFSDTKDRPADLGENARHIQQFYNALEAELSKLPPREEFKPFKE